MASEPFINPFAHSDAKVRIMERYKVSVVVEKDEGGFFDSFYPLNTILLLSILGSGSGS